MARKITNAAAIAECKQMVTENITYAQMDCQAAVEEVLVRRGIPASECNLPGSNAHYRRCYWRGTPERLCELLGVTEVPAGVFMFIVLASGEPEKYVNDRLGNADHMGIYMGNGQTFNSSSSRGGVEISTKFNGRKSVPNGGWNMAGLSEWIDCGLTDAQMAAIRADGNYTGSDVETQSTTETVETTAVDAVADTSGYYLIKKGCKGGAVERLQTWLNDLGYPVAVDHDFGPATEAAVIQYQSEHGLEADGIVGRLTWTEMAKQRGAKG